MRKATTLRWSVTLAAIAVMLLPPSPTQAAGVTTSNNGDITQGNNTAPTNTTVPTSNMNGNANSSMLTNLAGVAGNVTGAGILYAQSNSCGPPHGEILCAMAAVAVVAGIAQLASSQGDSNTAAATQGSTVPGVTIPGGPGSTSNNAGIPSIGSGDGGSVPLGNGATPGLGTPSGSALAAKLDAAKAQLAAAGFSVSPDGSTVTGPNGKSMPSSAFGSDAGLKSLGLSSSDIAQIDAIKLKASTAGQKAMMALLEDGGGGGTGGFGGGGKAASAMPGFGLPKNKKDLKANSAAGMTRQLGGDKIGVAGDDIFQMVSRQYQKRDHDDEFLK